MKFFFSIILIASLLLLSSCACQKCMMKHCQKKMADERIAVLAADSAFARASVQYGAAEAFNKYLAEDAIYEMFKASKRRYTLNWWPQDGQVSASGDLGWTWGKATFTLFGDNGDTTLYFSKYLTVWEKDKGGNWKVKVDIGNERPGE
jgi:hypothetical protein